MNSSWMWLVFHIDCKAKQTFLLPTCKIPQGRQCEPHGYVSGLHLCLVLHDGQQLPHVAGLGPELGRLLSRDLIQQVVLEVRSNTYKLYNLIKLTDVFLSLATKTMIFDTSFSANSLFVLISVYFVTYLFINLILHFFSQF